MDKSLFHSAAARLEAYATIPKRPRSLLAAFNGADAAVPDAVSAVTAIFVEQGIRNSIEAAAILAAFKQKAATAPAAAAAAAASASMVPQRRRKRQAERCQCCFCGPCPTGTRW